ncbi:calcyphosin-like isoform 1 [Camelus ferus]|nr:calcyphosin-like isoform 1 [Camelus ferus]
MEEQLLTSEAAVQSLQAAVRQRDKLIGQLQPRAELLQDICRRRPPLAGLLASLAEAERLGPLPASDPGHPLPGGPSSPLANSTGEEEDRDHLQPAVFGTTVCPEIMDAVDATMEKLRAQCLSRGASGIQGLAKFFRRLDRDGSRSLDAGELQRGLAELGLALDTAEAEGVCRRWDRDGSGTLDLEEFLRALRRGLAELGLALDTAEAEGVCRRWDRDGSGTLDLEEFLRALRPPMSQAREAVITAAFAKLDRSGDGVVMVDDLRGVYGGRAHPKVRSGQWTEEEVLRRFLDNFDSSEKDGQVTLAEFQDYYSGVSASVDTDEEFVAMMTSAWRL